MRMFPVFFVFAVIGAFTRCAFQADPNEAGTLAVNHGQTIDSSAAGHQYTPNAVHDQAIGHNGHHAVLGVGTGAIEHNHNGHELVVQSHLAAPHAQNDHVAIADMHMYARHNLGGLSEHPDSFGAADRWAHDWELRWLDYEVDGRTIRIYHATSKHNEALRYTSLWDGHKVRYHDWERVH